MKLMDCDVGNGFGGISKDDIEKAVGFEKKGIHDDIADFQLGVKLQEYGFRNFYKRRGSGTALARYSNRTAAGISGGGLFNKEYLIGVHVCGGVEDATQGGSMVTPSVWKWIASIQAENKNPCQTVNEAIVRQRFDGSVNLRKRSLVLKNGTEYAFTNEEFLLYIRLFIYQGNVEMVKALLEFITMLPKHKSKRFLQEHMREVLGIKLKSGSDKIIQMCQHFIDLGFNIFAAEAECLKWLCLQGGDLQLMQFLIDKGLTVDSSHLYYALSNTGGTKLLETLIRNGANVNDPPPRDHWPNISEEEVRYFGVSGTVLGAAADTGSIEVFQLLIDAKCDINRCAFRMQGNEHSALSVVCGQPCSDGRFIPIVKLLLESNADPDGLPGELLGPISTAASVRNVEILHVLLEAKGSLTQSELDRHLQFLDRALALESHVVDGFRREKELLKRYTVSDDYGGAPLS